MPAEVEIPLPASIWLSELRKLADSCANDNGDTEDRAVRRAFHFLKLSPPAILRFWASDLSESELEVLLDQGKVELAATQILGNHTALALSQDHARHIAVLQFDDVAAVRAEGATPALAMISAWARLLAAA